MHDLISRQDALDEWNRLSERGRTEFDQVLMILPSAQPEQDREFMKLTVRNSNGRPYYSIIYLEFDDNGIGNDFEGYSSYSLDVISDYLKKYFMQSAEPEQHWIPCSERLPDMWDERYLVSLAWGGIGVMEYKSTGFHNYGSFTPVPIESIIAWMPLPKPYKEGS